MKFGAASQKSSKQLASYQLLSQLYQHSYVHSTKVSQMNHIVDISYKEQAHCKSATSKSLVGRSPTVPDGRSGCKPIWDLFQRHYSGALSDCSIFHVAWLHFRLHLVAKPHAVLLCHPVVYNVIKSVNTHLRIIIFIAVLHNAQNKFQIGLQPDLPSGTVGLRPTSKSPLIFDINGSHEQLLKRVARLQIKCNWIHAVVKTFVFFTAKIETFLRSTMTQSFLLYIHTHLTDSIDLKYIA